MKKPIVAIDGPAGSGKGTVAGLLADRLRFAYLDTGLLYRAVAYSGERTSVQNLLKILRETPEDVLRSDSIGSKASEVSKIPEVRQMLLQLQRDFAENPGEEYAGSVLDGRDIATVVVPRADYKIFITADPEIRAARRFEFLKQTDPKITRDEIYRSLVIRDEQDRSRKIAPLIFSEDIYDILIDTSKDSIEESFTKVINFMESKSNKPCRAF
jgi:cytidylate kinase